MDNLFCIIFCPNDFSKTQDQKKMEVFFFYFHMKFFPKLSNQSDLGLIALGCCVSGEFQAQGVFQMHLIMKIMLGRSEQSVCHCLSRLPLMV